MLGIQGTDIGRFSDEGTKYPACVFPFGNLLRTAHENKKGFKAARDFLGEKCSAELFRLERLLGPTGACWPCRPCRLIDKPNMGDTAAL